MPLQNRVTPFGEIVAISQRGLFTGNRGIIHDPATKTLLKRRWTSKAWIICTCDYNGRRRDVMGGQSWTELFFLDEVVALAAGHRPCFFCRRDAAERFRAGFSAAHGMQPLSAPAMDAILHGERLERSAKRLHTISRPLADLPDGAMVAVAGVAFTLHAGKAYRWTNDGYAPPQSLAHADGLLTPPSTVLALGAGYRPAFHPTILPLARPAETVPDLKARTGVRTNPMRPSLRDEDRSRRYDDDPDDDEKPLPRGGKG